MQHRLGAMGITFLVGEQGRVHRVGHRHLGRQHLAQTALCGRAESRQRQPVFGRGIRYQHAQSARDREYTQARSLARCGWAITVESNGHVDQLVQVVDADQAGLIGDIAPYLPRPGQFAGVRHGRRTPELGFARAQHHDGFARGPRAARQTLQALTLLEPLDIQRDQLDPVIRQAVFDQLQQAEVGLVAGRYPVGKTDVQVIETLQQRIAQSTRLREQRHLARPRHTVLELGREGRCYATRWLQQSDTVRAYQPYAVALANVGQACLLGCLAGCGKTARYRDGTGHCA